MSDASVQVARQVTRAIKREAPLVAPPALTQQMTAAIAVELQPLIESVQRALTHCSQSVYRKVPGLTAVLATIEADLGQALAGAMLNVVADHRTSADFRELAVSMGHVSYWARGGSSGPQDCNTLDAIERLADAVTELCHAESRRAAEPMQE